MGFFRRPSVISQDDRCTKDLLESEQVCGCHFVSGKPAQSWDKHDVNWITQFGSVSHKDKYNP